MGKYLRKNKAKVNIPLRVAAVLYCLTVLTTYLVSGLYARYTASGQTGDQARVAAFSVEGSCTLSQSIGNALSPGGSESVDVVINNNSEVAVEYTVDVANVTGNLPLTFSMEKTSDPSSSPKITETGTRFTAQQLPGDHIDKYALKIQWLPDGTKAKDLDRMGMVDYITVTVTATQID